MADDNRHVEQWRPSVNPWIVALAVILPAFMEVIDTSIAAVCLPYIAGSLSASTDEATWVLTFYLLSNAVVLHASAWFSLRFGRKRFLMASILIFTVSSFACGASTSLLAITLARLVQGAGGMRFHDPSVLCRLREAADRYELLLIFDEIFTGFGRTGHLFAANMFGVTPDLLSFGKGVSGGYAPLSGVLIQERVARTFWGEIDDNVHFRAGHTYAGNPVAYEVTLNGP